MNEVYFVYVTTKGRISAYALTVPTASGDYFQGYTRDGGFKTFRKDRLIDFFDSLEQAEMYADILRKNEEAEFGKWRATVRGANENKYKRYESPGMFEPLDFSGPLEICFTGFKKEDKERLRKIAIDAGMIVRQDVTVNLHFLCGGYNAGPKKLEVARMKGTVILHEAQLLSLIETGELPDDYDNQ